MKKIFSLLFVLIVFPLSACENAEETGVVYEYSDLETISLLSHEEAENMSNEKYAVYYFAESCSHCQNIKQDILSFAIDFNYLDFYIIDISKASDSSSYEEFRGTPTVFVLSGGEIIESYVGSIEVLEFIDDYKEIQFDYDLFNLQHLTTYSEVLDIAEEKYLVYMYLESCPNCITIKEDFLSWAFTKNINEMYFINAAEVTNPDDLPTELQILGSGTPILIVMSNGVFTDEYYLGVDEILEYIE